jgi:hypothetical protein
LFFLSSSLESLAVSFNGGKDCTVLLHLVRAALYSLKHDTSARATASPHATAHATPNPRCRLLSSIIVVYFEQSDQFQSMHDFMFRSGDEFGFQLERYRGSFIDGVQQFLDQHDSKVHGILLGQRRVDPGARELLSINPSSPGFAFVLILCVLLTSAGQNLIELTPSSIGAMSKFGIFFKPRNFLIVHCMTKATHLWDQGFSLFEILRFFLIWCLILPARGMTTQKLLKSTLGDIMQRASSKKIGSRDGGGQLSMTREVLFFLEFVQPFFFCHFVYVAKGREEGEAHVASVFVTNEGSGKRDAQTILKSVLLQLAEKSIKIAESAVIDESSLNDRMASTFEGCDLLYVCSQSLVGPFLFFFLSLFVFPDFLQGKKTVNGTRLPIIVQKID